MNVDVLLNRAGSKPLKDFSWGQNLLDVINSELPIDRQAKLEDTGTEVSKMVRLLSAKSLMRVLSLRLDAEGRVLEEESRERDEDDEPEREKDEKPSEVEKPLLKRKINLRVVMPLMLGGGVTLMGLMLAAAMSITAVKTGQAPDGRSLEGIARVMGDMVRAFAGQAPAHAPAPAPQPAPTNPPSNGNTPPPNTTQPVEEGEELLIPVEVR